MELKETNKYQKAKCACCGYYSISQIAETCPVCNWEENIYQETYKDDNDAPNYVSLNEARNNYKQFGATKLQSKGNCRPPNIEELDGLVQW